MSRNGSAPPTISALNAADVDACHGLSAGAGWNQTVHDWRFLIRSGSARCIRDAAGTPLATTVALPYPPSLVWIGMVLVAPAYRGRGFARALMTDALGYASAAGLPPALDATPMGRPLYEKLGFVPVCEITRWRREAGLRPGAGAPGRPAAAVESGKPGLGGFRACQSLQEAVRRDAAAAGCERAALFEDLRHRDGTAMWCGTGDDMAVLRRGRVAWQLGPVVARGAALEAAVSLAVANSRGEAVVVDCPDGNAAATATLTQAGFSRARGFVRMVPADTAAPVPSPRSVAIAGPEYG